MAYGHTVLTAARLTVSDCLAEACLAQVRARLEAANATGLVDVTP